MAKPSIKNPIHYIVDQFGEPLQLRVEERGRPFLGYFWCVGTYERVDGKWLLCDIDWADDYAAAESKLASMLEISQSRF